VSKHGDVARGDGWELRLGPYQDVLSGVDVDALITDTPYSAKTHKGHDGGMADVKDDSDRRALSYSYWVPQDVVDFCVHWSPRVRGWFACMSDDVLAPVWRGSLIGLGRYGFAPVPCVIPGMTVRVRGDGPSSWGIWLNVARPSTKEFASWGTLRGDYRASPERGRHIGGKPLAMMRAIVRDYSRKGDLVCDPCAGGATTLLASVLEGRRAIGAELDPATFDKAVARLRRGYTPAFDFGDDEASP